MPTITDSGAIFKAIWLIALLLSAGCQAFADEDALATIDINMTKLAVERESIRAAATADRVMAAATVVAAGTRVAQHSAVNAALAATLRTSYTATPALRAVVVSAADMGSSLEDGMMDAEPGSDSLSELRVSSLAMAARINFNTGCADATVNRFSPAAERIYLTAQASNLSAGAQFSALWRYEGGDVSSHAWRAERSEDFLCIWFYVTPADFDFLPGSYTALLFVDGAQVGSVPFSISAQ